VLEVDLAAEVALAAVVVGAAQDRRAAVDMVLDRGAAVAVPAQGDHQGAQDTQVLVRVQAAATESQNACVAAARQWASLAIECLDTRLTGEAGPECPLVPSRENQLQEALLRLLRWLLFLL